MEIDKQNEIKLTTNEIAEIIKYLSDSASSMESYAGIEKTTQLANDEHADCNNT